MYIYLLCTWRSFLFLKWRELFVHNEYFLHHSSLALPKWRISNVVLFRLCDSSWVAFQSLSLLFGNSGPYCSLNRTRILARSITEFYWMKSRVIATRKKKFTYTRFWYWKAHWQLFCCYCFFSFFLCKMNLRFTKRDYFSNRRDVSLCQYNWIKC